MAVMTTVSDALFAVGNRYPTTCSQPNESNVVAILRLATSGRAWFVTGVCNTAKGVQVQGYEPGCQYSDERWFDVAVEFFESAARANEDNLMIEVLTEPVRLEMLEDVSL